MSSTPTSRLDAARKRLTDSLGSLTPETTRGSWTIGETGEYSTFEGALQASRDDTHPVTLTVQGDYQPRNDAYPIHVGSDANGEWVQTTIRGAGQGTTVLGHSDVTSSVLEVHGPPGGTQGAYHQPVSIRDLTIHGGLPDGYQDLPDHHLPAGIRIAGIPNGTIENVTLLNDGHGIQWSAPWREMTVDASHSFGWRVRDTEAWGTMDCYRIQPGAGAHQTSFSDCLANAAHGAGLRARGAAAVTWRGGSLQLNRGYGLRVDECEAFTLRDAYVEGNARNRDYPLEVYGDGAHGLTVDGCYFHGINPRGAQHDYQFVQRGVNLHRSQDASVTNNTVRRYPDAFITAMSGSTVEAHGNALRDSTSLYATIGDSRVTEYGQERTV